VFLRPCATTGVKKGRFVDIAAEAAGRRWKRTLSAMVCAGGPISDATNKPVTQLKTSSPGPRPLHLALSFAQAGPETGQVRKTEIIGDFGNDAPAVDFLIGRSFV
jgi:hypothetical protein